MKRIASTVTQRGQVTLPAEVRRLLGVKAKDKVIFSIEDGEVRVLPMEFTLETAFGSVKPKNRPEDFKALSRAVREEKVEETLREMRGE